MDRRRISWVTEKVCRIQSSRCMRSLTYLRHQNLQHSSMVGQNVEPVLPNTDTFFVNYRKYYLEHLHFLSVHMWCMNSLTHLPPNLRNFKFLIVSQLQKWFLFSSIIHNSYFSAMSFLHWKKETTSHLQNHLPNTKLTTVYEWFAVPCFELCKIKVFQADMAAWLPTLLGCITMGTERTDGLTLTTSHQPKEPLFLTVAKQQL